MDSALFCPHCLSYFPPDVPACPICAWRREDFHRPTPPLSPEWQASLPASPAGLAVLDERQLLVSWGRGGETRRFGQSVGGLTCLDLQDGRVQWSRPFDLPPSGPARVKDGWILQLLGLNPPNPASLLVLSPAGESAWQVNFPGPAAPLALPALTPWVYCALSDGTLLALNPSTREKAEVMRWDENARLNAPQSLAAGNGSFLYLATGTRPGQVLRIQGAQASRLFTHPERAYLARLLAADDGLLYLSDELGQLFALDSSGRPAWTFQASSAGGRPVRLGKMAICGPRLLFGARDHKLRCLDRASGRLLWETPTQGSVLGTPRVWGGALVLCSDSHGFCCGLDLHSGEAVWQAGAPGPGKWDAGASPALCQERAVFAARSAESGAGPSGLVWSLPYHAGKHAWAGGALEKMGRLEEAGDQYVLESRWCQACDQAAHLEKAALAWERARKPEWAARLWLGVGERERAVEWFQKAASSWRTRDPARAAFFNLKAAEVLEQDGRADAAERLRGEAEKLMPLPYLRLGLATNPTLVQNESGNVTLRIQNTGRAPARRVEIYVGGSLLSPLHFSADPTALIDPNRWWDLALSIVPTRGENRLDVIVECYDRPERKEPFRHFYSETLLAAPPPTVIKTGMMHRGKISVKNSSNQPIRLEVDDSVFTEILLET